MNILLTSQTESNGAVQLFTSGQFVGAGDEFTVDGNDDFVARYIANVGTFHRAEGQVVFQTPGRVTTIDFHASIDVNGCTFFGTDGDFAPELSNPRSRRAAGVGRSLHLPALWLRRCPAVLPSAVLKAA